MSAISTQTPAPVAPAADDSDIAQPRLDDLAPLSPAAERALSLYALSERAAKQVATLEELAAGLASDDPDQEAEAVWNIQQALGLQGATGRALAAKADSAAWACHSLRDRAELQKAHARRLTEQARRTEREADRLEGYILDCLQRAMPDQTRYDLGENRITSRRSVRVEVDRDADLPAELCKLPEPNLTAIKAKLQAGEEVKGAALVENRSWRLERPRGS